MSNTAAGIQGRGQSVDPNAHTSGRQWLGQNRELQSSGTLVVLEERQVQHDRHAAILRDLASVTLSA